MSEPIVVPLIRSFTSPLKLKHVYGHKFSSPQTVCVKRIIRVVFFLIEIIARFESIEIKKAVKINMIIA